MKKKQIRNIIFICKYNVFRSKVAESYFNQISKNKEIKVVSRGFISGGVADAIQKKVTRKFGLQIKEKFVLVNLKEMIKSDLIIIVANDIPRVMFNYAVEPIKKRVVIWEIPDEQKMNEKNIGKIVEAIKRKIEKLVKKLEAKGK